MDILNEQTILRSDYQRLKKYYQRETSSSFRISTSVILYIHYTVQPSITCKSNLMLSDVFLYQLLDSSRLTDFDCGLFHLPDLINIAHNECDRLTVDTYSSQAPDPSSGLSWSLCQPDSRICILYRNCEIYDCSLYTYTIHFFVGNEG
jgi:hypothetical protein